MPEVSTIPMRSDMDRLSAMVENNVELVQWRPGEKAQDTPRPRHHAKSDG